MFPLSDKLQIESCALSDLYTGVFTSVELINHRLFLNVVTQNITVTWLLMLCGNVCW